jgi:hypothetical protein
LNVSVSKDIDDTEAVFMLGMIAVVGYIGYRIYETLISGPGELAAWFSGEASDAASAVSGAVSSAGDVLEGAGAAQTQVEDPYSNVSTTGM